MDVEVFVSSDGTQYKCDRENEHFVSLTDPEVTLLKMKVSLMSDNEIQNRESGNGTPMGITIPLNRKRLTGIKDKLVEVLKENPFIEISQHAINRILTDAFLSDDDPNKRGWTCQDEVTECVLSAKFVSGVRLNVDYCNPDNTESVMHLISQFALVIKGEKRTGEGRLVLVILSENIIRVITVL